MRPMRSSYTITVDRPGRPEAAENGSRDEAAAAQYRPFEAATGYADAYQGSGPFARYFRSRVHLINQALAPVAGGDLLDIGCGPGMMVRELLDSRPDDFRIAAVDRSSAMVKVCAQNAAGAKNFRALVGRVESMPFADASFDVILAMGVLEYAKISDGLSEISRVLRPGGRVLVTMLNPLSPYRFFEWHIYWRLLRLIGRGRAATGIHAYSESALRGTMTTAGLRVLDSAYFDVTWLVPPVDRVVRKFARGWQKRPERTVSRGWNRGLGTGYLVVAGKA
jgi:ubiquinone/menaquinone biosynthesis C-methylase UbiE